MFDGHGFGGGGMWIFWILIVIALIWFATFATRRESASSTRQKSALEILKERYARGEIERDEFEQIKKDLSE
jgi:putative membrane protein